MSAAELQDFLCFGMYESYMQLDNRCILICRINIVNGDTNKFLSYRIQIFWAIEMVNG